MRSQRPWLVHFPRRCSARCWWCSWQRMRGIYVQYSYIQQHMDIPAYGGCMAARRLFPGQLHVWHTRVVTCHVWPHEGSNLQAIIFIALLPIPSQIPRALYHLVYLNHHRRHTWRLFLSWADWAVSLGPLSLTSRSSRSTDDAVHQYWPANKKHLADIRVVAWLCPAQINAHGCDLTRRCWSCTNQQMESLTFFL